ncbi:kunitz-type protease inhibitor 2-like [Oppia nitens]|uniref:kunitz-type protease inhibitor 2-like n=1 Tax=Oppia nitens TaxID=1686743 RepID=UPI0023DC0957|nr:kunitz-type protease inhibitor 2-like [Oppia nitens]
MAFKTKTISFLMLNVIIIANNFDYTNCGSLFMNDENNQDTVEIRNYRSSNLPDDTPSKSSRSGGRSSGGSNSRSSGGSASMSGDRSGDNDSKSDVISYYRPGLDLSEDKDVDKDIDCTSRPVEGMCRGNIPQYYCNPSKATCDVFYYGGCGGNANRYPNRRACQAACHSECPKRPRRY